MKLTIGKKNPRYFIFGITKVKDERNSNWFSKSNSGIFGWCVRIGKVYLAYVPPINKILKRVGEIPIVSMEEMKVSEALTDIKVHKNRRGRS